MNVQLRQFCWDERGQDLVESGLLASLLVIVLIGAVDAVGAPLGVWWRDIAGEVVELR